MAANTYSDTYTISAFFYELENDPKLKCRRCLEIKRQDVLPPTQNDLTVIMMNPGSCQPTEAEKLDEFIPAEPDPTLCQIMRVMDHCNLNYAKVINLSDYRERNSAEFFEKLKGSLKNKKHSIFSNKNERYLTGYLNKESIFLLSWGVNKKLSELSQKAVNKLVQLFEDLNYVGMPHPKNERRFYHPLPRTKNKQAEWVKNITDAIKNGRINGFSKLKDLK